MYKIVKKRQLNPDVFLLEIESKLISKKVKPGQFIMLRIDEFGERIPLTIADYSDSTITIIVQAIGATTMKLSKLEVGDCILDVVGPLGTPTDFHGAKKVCVVGGGVGMAIAYPSAKFLSEQGVDVSIIAGFRNKDIVILEEECKAISSNLTIMTDDGSYGNKGFVTTALKEKLEKESFDLVIAIGPIMMMRAVSEVTKPFNIHTIVSLNPIMIDGTGMCGGCRVSVGGQVKFACVDGPDFDAHLVDFDNLIARNRTYAEHEKHACRMGEK